MEGLSMKKIHFTLLGLAAILVLALALAGCGKTNNASNDGGGQDTANVEYNESYENDTTEPVTSDTPSTGSSQNADGKYVYSVDGHELALSVRLEDYIDGDELDFKALKKALGYTEGKVRDADGNILATTGEVNKAQPIAEISFYANLSDPDQEMVYYVTAKSGTDSQILTLASSNPAKNLSFNQLVVAVYLWDYYSDGNIHSDPLIDELSDYRTTLGSDRKIAYQLP